MTPWSVRLLLPRLPPLQVTAQMMKLCHGCKGAAVVDGLLKLLPKAHPKLEFTSKDRYDELWKPSSRGRGRTFLSEQDHNGRRLWAVLSGSFKKLDPASNLSQRVVIVILSL